MIDTDQISSNTCEDKQSSLEHSIVQIGTSINTEQQPPNTIEAQQILSGENKALIEQLPNILESQEPSLENSLELSINRDQKSSNRSDSQQESSDLFDSLDQTNNNECDTTASMDEINQTQVIKPLINDLLKSDFSSKIVFNEEEFNPSYQSIFEDDEDDDATFSKLLRLTKIDGTIPKVNYYTSSLEEDLMEEVMNEIPSCEKFKEINIDSENERASNRTKNASAAKNVKNIDKYVDDFSSNQTTLVCTKCESLFYTKLSFKMHTCSSSNKDQLDNSKSYECSICKYKTTYIGNLQRHVSVVHLKQRDFACSSCNKTFSERRGLRKHLEFYKDHSGSFDSLKNASKSLNENVGFVKSEETDTINCNFCSFTATSMNDAITHAELLHADQTSCKCRNCDKELPNFETLSDHLITCVGHQIKSKENKKQDIQLHIPSGISIKCNGCATTFSDEKDFKKHISSQSDCPGVWQFLQSRNNFFNSDLKQLTCPKCNYIAENKNFFLKHEKECFKKEINYGSTQSRCSKCGAIFKDEQSLLKHTFQRSCRIRSSQTESAKTVKDKEEENELTVGSVSSEVNESGSDTELFSMDDESYDSDHVTLKTYQCAACSYSFTSAIKLKKHSKVCSSLIQDFKQDLDLFGNEKSSHCKHCSYKSSNSTNLVRHIKTVHFKERRFSCTSCSKTFVDKRSADKHIQRNCTANKVSKIVVSIKISPKKENPLWQLKEISKFSCFVCSHVTPSIESMNAHVKTQHIIKTERKSATIKRENPRKYPITTKGSSLLCDQCPFQAKAKYTLKSHIQNCHLKKWEHICKECSRTFTSAKNFQFHSDFNQKSGSLKCTNYSKKIPPVTDLIFYNEERKVNFCICCNYYSTSMTEVEEHVLKNHTDKRTFTCNKCSSEYTTKFDLFKHLKICYEQKDGTLVDKEIPKPDIFRCDRCKYQCSGKSKMCLHNWLVHYNSSIIYPNCYHIRCDKAKEKETSPKNNFESKIYQCEDETCHYQSTTKVFWQNHVKAKHEKRHFCQGCFSFFEDKVSLTKHTVANSDGTSNLTCSKYTSQSANDMKHIFHNEQTNLYNCKKCNYSSESLDQANHHAFSTHLEPTNYFCNGCILELTNQKDLYHHLLDCQATNLSSEEKQNLQNIINKQNEQINKPQGALRATFKCNKCSYHTTLSHNLDRHNRVIHLNNRDIVCEGCLLAFASRGTFIKHKRNNSDHLGQLQCQTFTAKTFKVSELISLNKDETNFSCLLCNQSEQTESALKKHFAENHLFNVTFICNTCKEYFPDKTSLIAHSKTSHLTRKFAKTKFCQDISEMSIKNVDTKQFICLSCSFVTANAPEARAHIFENHVTLAQYTCDKCKQDFGSNRIFYLRHLRICCAKDSTAEFVSCHLCQFDTKLSSNLLAHLRRRHHLPKE